MCCCYSFIYLFFFQKKVRLNISCELSAHCECRFQGFIFFYCLNTNVRKRKTSIGCDHLRQMASVRGGSEEVRGFSRTPVWLKISFSEIMNWIHFNTVITLIHICPPYCLPYHYENMLIQIYWKCLPPKNEHFQIKNSDIFHISAQNIDCGYSLETASTRRF